MDEACATKFGGIYEEYKAEGGKVDGVVEWIGEPEEAKKVRLAFIPSFILSLLLTDWNVTIRGHAALPPTRLPASPVARCGLTSS